MIDQNGNNLAFILGLPRSGTTLLSVILDRHPQVLCPPEPWMMLALESVGKVCVRHPADSHLIGQSFDEFSDTEGMVAASRAFASTLYNRRLQDAGKSVFVDKTPRYYHILPFVRRTFNDAKWIWLQRNPLDVAASYKNSWKVNLADLLNSESDYPAWSFDLVIGLERLCHDVDSADPRVKVLQYEKLVAEPESCTSDLMSFVGLEATADQCCFDLADSAFARSFAGDKNITSTNRPHAQSIGTWKTAFCKDELQILLDFIGAETLRRLGYSQSLCELKELGVSDRGPHVTAECRSHIGLVYAERWADVQAASRVGVPLPWVQRAEAQLTERRSAIAKLTSELTNSRQHEQELDTQLSHFRELADSAAKQLAQAQAELSELRESAEERRRVMEDELAEQRRQIADLTRNLADATARYSRLETKSPWPQPWRRRLSMLAQHAIIGFPHARRRKQPPLPSITIVTPVFNGESHVREAIDSVLSQNYPNLQYIIADGGSSDRTMAIVNEYRDRLGHVISEKDNGMYDAIAKGFEFATGEILGYLNCDDVYEPGGLLRVGEFFRDHPKASVVYHEDTVLQDGWKFPNAAQPPKMDRIAILRGHILFQDGVFFRRRAYRAVGGVNRLMRRAGDWDLWVRLANVFRFRRGKGHQSCFRIRAGQLSADMASYNAELQHARAQWYQKIGPVRLSRLRHFWHRVENLLWRKLVPRRLFFSIRSSKCIDGAKPTPGKSPPFVPDQPRCPLTGARADRLLFSSRDTRFGDDLINHIYHCTDSDVAVTYPPLTKEQLNELYERHYSNSEAKIITPPDGYVSPYVGFRGGSPFQQLLRRAILPSIFAHGIKWEDDTEQLIGSVPGLPREGGQIHFLDVGCFDGKLLTAVARCTDWKTYGLEPNSKAAEMARREGHQVWQGFAEDATWVIPLEMSFDVIHLGQTIEHLGDPLSVVRRLRGLLKPGGRIVLSTPNLHSWQIDLFGPTWSHWHPPYHRFLFSPKSLKMMAKLADMDLIRLRSYSHPYWTCMSVQLNRLGCGAAVPHTITFPDDIVRQASSLTLWSKWLYDWRGKGDYLVAVFRKR